MINFTGLERYWHTVRYLKLQQICWRAWYRVNRPRPKPLEAMPLRQVKSKWQGCARTPSLVAHNRFRFLNVEQELTSAADWNHSSWPKLWLYNLHYFDDLVADEAQAKEQWHRDLIARWILENPPAEGNGWEPYPISLRAVNWCKWLLQGREAVSGMLSSLVIQADLLSRKLEYHLLGNHLWANFKALIFCGAIFQGTRADKWLIFGLQGFREQLGEQVLSDGVHFERSPMYQAILLEDLLDLLQLASISPDRVPVKEANVWREQTSKMLDWLKVMSHPDGQISFFNDAAFGIAPTLGALRDYAERLGLALPPLPMQAVVDLPDSGYCRLSKGDAVLLIDAAPIGPDYLPGHAHADTLSFELSLYGQRFLVNGGTSTYQADEQRLRERSTAMHNTVEVDGQNSSEVWGAFRVARRARIVARKIKEEGEVLVASASHDGYRQLPGRVIHHRQWRLGDGWLEVRDHLDGVWKSAIAYFHIALEIDVEVVNANQGTLTLSGRPIHWSVSSGGRVRLVDGSWHPEFGKSVPCKVLEAHFSGPELVTRFEWA